VSSKAKLLIAVLVALSPTTAIASPGTEGASFLDIPVGAEPAALGSAYAALATNAYAPIYNPAGLGFVSAPEVAGQHLSYLESINYEFGSVVVPLPMKNSALGVSVQYLGSGDIIGTDPSGKSAPDFSAHFAAYSLAYGQKILDRLSLGVTGKMIQAKIADATANAYAADAGALYEVRPNLRLAFTAANIGSDLKFTDQGDSLPLTFHLAAAYQPDRHVKLVAEGMQGKTGKPDAGLGVEWSPIEMVALRAGYKTDTTKELSATAGLTTGIGVRLWGQEFAYAWLPYGDLGDTQYFSLLIRFGQQNTLNSNMQKAELIRRYHGKDLVIDNDVEYQQLIQLLSHDEPRMAQAQNSGGAN